MATMSINLVEFWIFKQGQNFKHIYIIYGIWFFINWRRSLKIQISIIRFIDIITISLIEIWIFKLRHNYKYIRIIISINLYEIRNCYNLTKKKYWNFVKHLKIELQFRNRQYNIIRYNFSFAFVQRWCINIVGILLKLTKSIAINSSLLNKFIAMNTHYFSNKELHLFDCVIIKNSSLVRIFEVLLEINIFLFEFW